MNVAHLKPITRRPAVIISALLTVAVLSWFGVNRLVNRFHEQEKALARHLYERGQRAQDAGNPEAALGDFRAALNYSHDNFQHELSLARALRDTGRTAEAETYLIGLWEHSPQEGPVNLALGRLFAREQQFDKAVQYYHSAIYGLWASDPEVKRRTTQLELIEFLLQHKAYPQAQAELTSMASALPRDPSVRLQVAGLLVRAQDNEHAFSQYQQILHIDPRNAAALYGAGQAAFALGRYRTAQTHLQMAVRENPENQQARHLLETATLISQVDPFVARISDKERNKRLRSAFLRAGDRLNECAKSQNIDLSPQLPANGLPALEGQWVQIKPRLAKLSSSDGVLDQVMDLVFEIERQTQSICGAPQGADQALLLISQDRAGVEQ